LGGVKHKSLCNGFSADRAALEKLKYGLWTRIYGAQGWDSNMFTISGLSQRRHKSEQVSKCKQWIGTSCYPLYDLSDYCELDLEGLELFPFMFFVQLCENFHICRFNSWVRFFCFFMQVPFAGWLFSQFIDAGSDLMLGFSLVVFVGSIHVWLQTPKHCQK